MNPSKGAYADTDAMRRRYALQLLEEASKNAPVQHPLQALARALQGGLGGYYARQLEREQLEKGNPTVESIAVEQPVTDLAWTVRPAPLSQESIHAPSGSTEDWSDQEGDDPAVILAAGRGENWLQSHPQASGSHSSFKEPEPGEAIEKYVTWERNPHTGEFVPVKRYRGVGREHYEVPPPLILERERGTKLESSQVETRGTRRNSG